VEQLIDAKREHKEPPKAEEPEAPTGKVVDLMAALQESVTKARTARGEDATIHEMPEKTAARTETKQPAKKAAAKKTSKKATARKPRSA
jgi:DNA end-binding protein Ku